MNARSFLVAAAATVLTAFTAVPVAPVASAVPAQPFGTWQTLYEPNNVVTGYMVRELAPATEPIPYPVVGRLYEATVTVLAQRGDVTPLIPLFTARAASGQAYPVLAGVGSTWGLSPATLPPGARSTGRIYFDVVGDIPNSVIYGNGAAVWVGEASTRPGPPPPPLHHPMMPNSSMPVN